VIIVQCQYCTEQEHYNEYGSFAGEFHVDGEVKLNVITKKYHVTGSQTVEQWEDIEQEGSLA
jgi:cytoskeletal protein CcmA (bactofilin family)